MRSSGPGFRRGNEDRSAHEALDTGFAGNEVYRVPNRRRAIRTTVSSLVAKLSAASPRKREAALAALAEMDPADVLGPVADLLLQDSASDVHAACLDLLERLQAVAPLADVRTDGWFDRLAEGIGSFQTIKETMGERFLAYAIILGIQIRTLVVDPRFPANTSVEFSVGDEAPETLTLGEFRVRLVQALIHEPMEIPPIVLPLTTDQATGVLGSRLLLLAPLFGISLEMLIAASLDEERPRALVGFVDETGFGLMDVRDFGAMIKDKVRRDLAGTICEPFRLDLGAVHRAREAAERGDPDEVIATLETWPGLLSLLQRTPVAQQLDGEQLATIGEGLELLGAAFEQRGRRHWSEELYRLGLQFVREGQPAARLFLRLGVAMVESGRHGEAIGLLRRALALGMAEERVFPVLGRAFLERGKIVAAMALLETATRRGWGGAEAERDLETARRTLEKAGVRWSVPPPEA